MVEPKKSKRGFASMTPEQRREIASKGGKSVRPENRSFSKNAELAAAAGKKGGLSVDGANRPFSRDRFLAAKAGQAGGTAAAKKRREKPE